MKYDRSNFMTRMGKIAQETEPVLMLGKRWQNMCYFEEIYGKQG